MTRELPEPGFAGDTGAPDPALATALDGWAAGGDPAPVLAALRGARLLVPVIAVGTVNAAGAEKSTDMALVSIRGADGRTALPAFTSLATLTAWNAEARPVPVAGPKAALATLAEEADLLVLDAAGPVTYPVEGAGLRALARGRVPLPARDDPEVTAALYRLLAPEAGIVAACLLPSAEGADAVLGLVLDGHPDQVVPGLAGDLAADPVLRERLDRGLDVALLPGSAELSWAVVVLDRREPVGGC